MTNYPKIGIRPTIDGRQGGIREGLEEKTMALANAVKNLIESNLRNGDGSKVECIISDTTIILLPLTSYHSPLKSARRQHPMSLCP